MARADRRVWLVAILVMLPLSPVHGQSPDVREEAFRIDSLDVPMGQFRDVSFGTRNSLFVSRKGVIDLREKAPGSYVVTGLRLGVVYIDEKTPEDALLRRVLVRVSKTDVPKAGARSPKRTKLGEDGAEADSSWRMFCGKDGLTCGAADDGPRGSATSWPVFVDAWRACRASPPCSPRALGLTASARDEFRAYLRENLGPAYAWRDVARLPLVVEAPCRGAGERAWHEERVSEVLGDIPREALVVRCQGEGDEAQVALRVRAFFLSHEEAESMGLAWGKGLRQGAWRSLDASFLDAFWDSQEARAHLVGEPSFRTLVGAVHKADGGAEFLVPSRQPEKEDQWKKVGLSVEGVLWREGDRGTYVWRYKLGLSEPRSGGDSSPSLTANAMAGDVRVAAGRPELVGSLLTVSRVEKVRKWPWFSDWPIIGPWLRHTEDVAVEGRLYIRIEVAADQASAAEREEWRRGWDEAQPRAHGITRPAKDASSF